VSDIECGGGLTIVKIRDCLQDMAVGVEGLWSTDPTGGVSVRVQDNLCVDKVPGGDSLVQGLTKSSGGRHAVSTRVGGTRSVIGRIYGIFMVKQTPRFGSSPQTNLR